MLTFVIKAGRNLHNFLTVLNKPAHVDTEDQFGNVVAGLWQQNIQRVQVDDGEPHLFNLETTKARNYNLNVAIARNLFTAYTCSRDGDVAWQWNQPGVSKEAARVQVKQLLPARHS